MLISLLITPQELISNRLAKYGELKLELKESVILRELESDRNYIFGSFIGDLAVDKEGNLYILDSDRFVKYDDQGRYIQTIGKTGEGPGEFQRPTKLFIHDSGDVYVNDRGRFIHIFTKNGIFKDKINLKFNIFAGSNNFFVDHDNSIFAITMEISGSGPHEIFVKADKNGNIIKKIEVIKDPKINVKSSTGVGGVMSGMIHSYSEQVFFCPIQKNLFCYGTNIKYRIFLCNLEGGLKAEFSKDEDFRAISAEEKKRLGTGAFIPSHRPFFKNILSDEEGRIYVLKTKSILDKNPNTEIDIFSSAGKLLYEIQVPFTPRVIKNGAFYSIEQDVNQNRSIKKWVIQNYELLKKS